MAESPTAACHLRVVASIATDCTCRCRPTISTCIRKEVRASNEAGERTKVAYDLLNGLSISNDESLLLDSCMHHKSNLCQMSI